MGLKWNFTSEYNFKDENFSKIYKFFVIECPCEDVSVRGKSFKKIGCNMNSLNNALKKGTSFLEENWIRVNNSDIEQTIKEKNIYEKVNMPLEIAIHTNRDKSKTKGLFYSIRCAFAHGAFSIHKCDGEQYYFLENKYKGKLKGRIVVKEQSLLSWIEIVKSFDNI